MKDLPIPARFVPSEHGTHIPSYYEHDAASEDKETVSIESLKSAYITFIHGTRLRLALPSAAKEPARGKPVFLTFTVSTLCPTE